MGAAPSTVEQLILLVVVVLPGMTYQFLRERWRGPVPAETEAGQRILRAITASVVLDGCYLVLLGPQLEALYRPGGMAAQPRLAGFLALILLFGVPAAIAGAVSWLQRRRLRGRYRATPTAWDHLFRDRPPSFVRARLKDGTWVGGWYGPRSYASSFPQPPELYLQTAWRMKPDGTFVGRVEKTAGVYLRSADVNVIEILDTP